MARLGLILGDQLNKNHALFDALDPGSDLLLMGELSDEASYVWHHGQKIALIFAAMRHHAESLARAGWSIRYRRYDDEPRVASFSDMVAAEIDKGDISEIVLAWPGEQRLVEEFSGWEKRFGLPVTWLEDTRFLCQPDAFERWASGRKQLRMEYFYREMRKRHDLLMDGSGPAGGAWNYDKANRKPWKGEPAVVAPMSFTPDDTTREVLDLVENSIDHFGELEEFDWPVTHAQAERALSHFINRVLPNFGDYQDALDDDEPYLFHARLSAALNLGLLDPLEVCRRAEQAWQSGDAPLNAVEGFIRQIIGWREYIRGIYWREMPGYDERNALNEDQPLPSWYWSGKTRMRCLEKAIDSTRRLAYAHHIQRLMVTGNFALLLGIVPREICEWYLAVYADAYDWVELPNTLGMVMHADGGLLASKPYAASGKYIQRMGNHCANCPYQVKDTLGDKACPFNALYWDFLIRHRQRFSRNPRMGMMYKNVDRMSQDRVDAIKERAAWIKDNIETL
ncbi:MAG: cryptochrome/photolyase family protein [Wenzhouxiangella sp.]